MSLYRAVLDLFYPPKCPFCARLLEDARALVCPDCQEKLPWLTGEAGERRVDFAEHCFSPLAYRDGVPEGVRRLKFGKVKACAGPFGRLAAQCLQDHLSGPVDAVTWVPLSRARLRERGFDQAEQIACAAAEALSLPCAATLDKIRDAPPQSGLEDESARRANVLGAYALRPGAAVEGKRWVLVDDVVTTGSTLGECARVLRQGGAAWVSCLTLAQARRGGRESSHKNEKNG